VPLPIAQKALKFLKLSLFSQFNKTANIMQTKMQAISAKIAQA